jgi:hypothetical protein
MENVDTEDVVTNPRRIKEHLPDIVWHTQLLPHLRVERRVTNTPQEMLKDIDNNTILHGKHASGFVEHAIANIVEFDSEEKISSRLKAVLVSQYKAIDYLYGKGITNENKSDYNNPLVDILTLVVNPKFKYDPSDFRLGVKGKPIPEPIVPFVEAKAEEKAEQFRVLKTPRGKVPYRTITNFKDNLPTVIRGLYVIAEVSKHNPQILPSTLDEYNKSVSNASGDSTGMAIGILETLKNARLLYDPRFHSFASQLRNIVLDDVKNYPSLKKIYSYSIINDRNFWFQGELHYGRIKEPVKYVGRVSEKNKPAVKNELRLPYVEDWQHVCKNRNEIISKIRSLTPVASIKKTALNFSTENAIAAVRQDRLEKTLLASELTNLQRKSLEKLQNRWRTFVNEELSENLIIESHEVDLVDNAAAIIAWHFITDPSLSEKSRTIFKSMLDIKPSEYEIAGNKLVNDPVFSWVLDMFNDETRASFDKSVTSNPENMEAFYQLMRLMVYETAKVSFQKKELDFLFDSKYKQKMDPTDVTRCLDKILSLISHYTPDTTRLTANVLKGKEDRIHDLLAPDRIKKIQEDIDSITFNTIFPFRFKLSKSYSDRDKKAIIKSLKFGGKISLGIAGSTLFWSMLGSTAGGQAQAPTDVSEGYKTPSEPSEIEKWLGKLLGESSKKSTEQEELIKVLNSGFPDDVADRLPDAINHEDLEGMGLAYYGDIYHLPKSLEAAGGEVSAVAYFPWAEQLKVWNDIYPDYFSVDNFERKFFTDTQIVDDIDKFVKADGFEFSEDSFAYKLTAVPDHLFAPNGYMTAGVIQEGGTPPLIGALGELDYSQSERPTEVLVIATPLKLETVDGSGGKVIKDVGLSTGFIFDGGMGEDLVDRLQGSPELAALQSNFIREMDESRDNRGSIDNLSDIATKYAVLYAQYTNERRFYALSFDGGFGNMSKYLVGTANESQQDYLALEAIASHPDNGYFCSVASYAFRDFMASAGVITSAQPGITLYNYQNHLIGTTAHQNNKVFLPNGEVLEVDMTPPSTNQTPAEDIAVQSTAYLNDKNIQDLITKKIDKAISQGEAEERKKRTREIANNVVGIVFLSGLGLSAAGLCYMGLASVYGVTKDKFIKMRIEKALKVNNRLSRMEKEIVASATGHLAVSAYDANFGDRAVEILNVVKDYNADRHDRTVRWLEDEGVMLLTCKNSKEAFDELCKSVKTGGDYEINEIRRNMPDDVFDVMRLLNNGVEDEVPEDFDTAFKIASLMYDNNFQKFAKNIYKNLDVEVTGQKNEGIQYKVDDMLETLEHVYKSYSFDNEAKSRFNAIYNMLGGKNFRSSYQQ